MEEMAETISQLNQHTGQHIRWPWKNIWKIKAPFNVRCFYWLLVRRAYLTHENLETNNQI